MPVRAIIIFAIAIIFLAILFSSEISDWFNNLKK